MYGMVTYPGEERGSETGKVFIAHGNVGSCEATPIGPTDESKEFCAVQSFFRVGNQYAECEKQQQQQQHTARVWINRVRLPILLVVT